MSCTAASKPLAGVRVLDLGIITAGAATSALLADLGAEVIKVESPTYRDPFRVWVPQRPQDRDKLSPHFRATNRGKRSVAINVKTSEGRDCLLRLARHCDVVVENFRRGVMDKLGIGFGALKASNPRIVLASVSSQGETGPDALYVSYGSTLESMGGMAWLTGYAGGPPIVSGVDLNYPDQVVAILAAGAVCAALQQVRAGGEAVHLDISQRELTSFLISDAFGAELQENPRTGNADPEFWLQDCFLAQDGRWVAVSVPEEHKPAFEELTGGANSDGWFSRREAADAVDALADAGIPASVSLAGEEVLAAREWRTALSEGADGQPLKGTPFALDGVEAQSVEIAAFGADTIAVLREVGGFTAAEIDALHAKGIIVTEEDALAPV
jgi:crotonobetainyl-CoA:carnitine CoA-transferase CaiB-like acyl-CoA transferase